MNEFNDMFRKFVKKTLSLFFCLYSAQSVNYQLLEINADTFNNSIWSKFSISLHDINRRLTFLEDEDEKLIEKYTQEDVFEKLYQEKYQKINNEKFREFSNQCKEIYDFNKNFYFVEQAAVHMLYERTAEKVESFYDECQKDKEERKRKKI